MAKSGKSKPKSLAKSKSASTSPSTTLKYYVRHTVYWSNWPKEGSITIITPPYAIARPSVDLSVCQSHGWISPKRLKYTHVYCRAFTLAISTLCCYLLCWR